LARERQKGLTLTFTKQALNNPMAISPNTDPSRKVASGWEPHHKNTDLSRKILIVQKTSAAEA
jgi:hypothetical protein